MTEYTYAEFLADVAEQRVFVSGLGVGSAEGAWITVSGRADQPGEEGARHLRAALESGRFQIEAARLVPRTRGNQPP